MASSINPKSTRSELVEVATAMIDGRIDLIDGVRRITVLRYGVEDPDSEVFLPIRAAESETDHFVLGDARQHCAPEYLRELDAELARYLSEAQDEILSACKDILRKYSRAPLRPIK
jgi:hypothetical protein